MIILILNNKSKHQNYLQSKQRNIKAIPKRHGFNCLRDLTALYNKSD